jgi:formate/nitrite transporter FocA (FNT family)
VRYRLYEIDRLISRTIAYAVLSAIVGGLFVGLILVCSLSLDRQHEDPVALALAEPP